MTVSGYILFGVCIKNIVKTAHDTITQTCWRLKLVFTSILLIITWNTASCTLNMQTWMCHGESLETTVTIVMLHCQWTFVRYISYLYPHTKAHVRCSLFKWLSGRYHSIFNPSRGRFNFTQDVLPWDQAQSGVKMLVSLSNLSGASAALLLRHLPNFGAIGKLYPPISRPRDIARTYDKTSYAISVLKIFLAN